MTVPARVVFFGTPQYAVPALQRLAADERFDVALVVTQPDRPGGRGNRLIVPAVKSAAEQLGLPVLQPATLRDEAVREHLRAIEADLFVVAAYGLIFSQAVLDIPRQGCVNLHASILPAYRGAAPIPAAILNGDDETGITLMVMERGLDTGPIIAVASTPILPDDTAESLTTRLAEIGAELTVETLPRFLTGEIVPVPQPEGATTVRQMRKSDGQIDWRQSAAAVDRQVRAMWPWPRAWTELGDKSLQIHRAAIGSPGFAEHPGTVTIVGGRPVVVCGDGVGLEIEVGQFAGARAMAGADLVRGRTIQAGDRFTSGETPADALIRIVETVN